MRSPIILGIYRLLPFFTLRRKSRNAATAPTLNAISRTMTVLPSVDVEDVILDIMTGGRWA